MDKETVQMISWSIEIVTFITAMLVVWFIWRASKRASENHKLKQKSARTEPH